MRFTRIFVNKRIISEISYIAEFAVCLAGQVNQNNDDYIMDILINTINISLKFKPNHFLYSIQNKKQKYFLCKFMAPILCRIKYGNAQFINVTKVLCKHERTRYKKFTKEF